MPNNQLPHITIDDFSQSDNYVSPKSGQGPAIKRQNRAIHGNRIREQLLEIKEEFDVLKDAVLPENIVRENAIYVEFVSELDFQLAFDSLNSDKKNPEYQILNIRKEILEDKLKYRVNVIKPDEDLETFKKRINKNSRENETDTGYTGEDWMIKPNSRNKGSIHRDFWIGSGADLSTRNCIAVYPTSGWYKTRKKLEKYDSVVRYSLIVSIETPEIEVDIYTPVRNLVAIEV
ncbi:MAG: hypothetical protein PF436_03170 [Prolixibacteraceae bacterium]|jgi:hypothetical protein|nr:hypothetical protein [Prolixibacteraceae bacterium]